MIEKKVETKGHDAVFDSVFAWRAEDNKIYVRVEGMGNVRTLFFDLDLIEPTKGIPVSPQIESRILRKELELISVNKEVEKASAQVDKFKIKLGKELKKLDERKDRIDKYCETKKSEIRVLTEKCAKLSDRNFIKSCTDFSKALLTHLSEK